MAKKKIFVLDTSVILYDHNSVKNFADNDVAIPIQVLEELDTFKKGGDSKNYEARSFIRFLNTVSSDSLLNNWVKIARGLGKLKIVKEIDGLENNAADTFDDYKNDNKIINAAAATTMKVVRLNDQDMGLPKWTNPTCLSKIRAMASNQPNQMPNKASNSLASKRVAIKSPDIQSFSG